MDLVNPVLRSSRWPRLTWSFFYCGIINKTVQIPGVRLNIESIVSFRHNTLQTGEGMIEASIPVSASLDHAEVNVNFVDSDPLDHFKNTSKFGCSSPTTPSLLSALWALRTSRH